MKRLILLFALLLICPLFATTIDGVLQIPKTSVAPVIDGEMDDVWYYAGKERNDVFVKDVGIVIDEWLDLWATYRMMWDDAGVYLFVEVYDDHLFNSASDSWNNDSIDLYFDGDNSKNDVSIGYDQNDQQIRFILNTSEVSGLQNCVCAWKETTWGYTLEAFWPGEDFYYWEPENNLEVGFDLRVNDNDNEINRENIISWYGDTNETWHDASTMGTAKFRGSDYRTIQDMLDISYVVGAPTIDGERETWWDALPNVGMNTYVDAAGETDITLMSGAYDLDFKAWQGWNENGFYLYVSIIDDELSTANANTYEQDSIELFFDGDNSKNDVTTGYDDHDMQCRIVYMNNTIEAGIGTAPKNGVVSWKDTDLGADCEIFIPAIDIEKYFPLVHGREIGYEIQINDDDAKGTREAMARWWSNSLETWHDPSYMGRARLVRTIDNRLTIVSPDGGEEFFAGSQVEINWNTETNCGEVKIEYSTDDGKEWRTIVKNTMDVGTYLWTVPNVPTESCLIRVKDTDSMLFDVSDNTFSIHIPNDDWYKIPFTRQSPVIDGQMDAVWYNVDKYRHDKYVLENNLVEPDNWLDLWSNSRMLYDDTGLYLFVKVYDDQFSSMDYKDSIELLFDGDNTKNNDLDTYKGHDSYIRFERDELAVVGNSAVICAWKETAFGYQLEAYLPNEVFKDWQPAAGKDVGFEIQLGDCDQTFERHLNKWWSDSFVGLPDPSSFGNALFCSPDERSLSNVLDINYQIGTPAIDGIREPWWDNLTKTGMNTYIDAGGEIDITLMSGAYDLDFNAWQGWNENGFYLYISIIDDVLSTANANTYEQDSIELFFDGDNSKNDVLTGYDTNDMQCRMVYMVNAIEVETGVAPENAVVAWRDTDLGADCEVFIPASDIQKYYPLEVGQKIGYEIQINDDDAAGTREAMARWWDNTNESWHDPSRFGEARLVNGPYIPTEPSGKLEIESAVVYDFYGGDRVIQPGEFFRIEFNVQNNTNQHFQTAYAVPDSSYDPYVHPMSQYFFDTYLSVDVSPDPGKSSPVDPLDCYVAPNTPSGYEITIPVSFYGDNKWISNDTLRFVVQGSDHTEPFYDYPFISHSTITSGEAIEFSTKIFEAGSILNPQAIAKNGEGEIVATTPLYDDGSHGDTLSGDRVYHANWVFNKTGNYTIDVSAEDNSGNVGLKEKYFSFVCVGTDGQIFNRVTSTGSCQIIVVKKAKFRERSLVPGDIIGVFDDSLCVGVGLYQGTFPMSIVVVSQVELPNGTKLSGAKSGHFIQYKIYNSEKSCIVPVEANYEEGDHRFGNVLTVLSTLSESNYSILIAPNRFNWISFDDITENRTPESLFGGLSGLRIVMDDVGNHYMPEYNINTLDDIQSVKGYMVYSTRDNEHLYYSGSWLNPEDINVDLKAFQMHLIGCPYHVAFHAEEVFETIKESVIIVKSDEGKYWIPELDLHTLDYMHLGEAYQIYLKEDVVFTFPNLSSSMSKQMDRNNIKFESEPQHFEYVETGLPQAVVITGSNEPLNISDEIALFDGDLCVGAAVFEGSFPLVLTAWEGSEELDLSGFKVGNPMIWKIWKNNDSSERNLTVKYQSQTDGKFERSAMTKVELSQMSSDVASSNLLPKEFALNQNYPNPFNPQTTIQYQLPKSSSVNLSIYNTVGQKVVTLADAQQSAGQYEVIWNGENDNGVRVESGLYLVRLTTEKNNYLRKIMLIK